MAARPKPSPSGRRSLVFHLTPMSGRRCLTLCARLAASHAPGCSLAGVSRGPWGDGAACHAARGRRLFAVQATEPPKAAFLVIGDELLRGQVADANTSWLAKTLHAQGVDLTRVTFVPDEVSDIVDTVRDLRHRVGPGGFVFTAGGIGCTHDDVTYDAIAKAFDRTLERHSPTVERMREQYTQRGLELTEVRLRMATLPTPCEVLHTDGLWVPLVHLEGVYVLPGIPRLFQQMLGQHKGRFVGPAVYDAVAYTHSGEGDIAVVLGEIARDNPEVSIGSYPNTSNDTSAYKVKISCMSRSQDAVEAAISAIRGSIPCVDAPV